MADDRINTVSRALIETFVSKKLDDLKEDPDRGTRNLIDMALNTTKGRFQKRFFLAARKMMENPRIGYYHLIQDTVAYVDKKHLLNFGMNLGYNSLTAGAKIIREIEKEQGFNIPWVITLCVNGASYDRMEPFYQDVIEQGKRLGVYSWIIFALSGAEKPLSLIKNHPDCAFLLVTSPGEITTGFLDSVGFLENLMLAVKYEPGREEIFTRMRRKRLLYSACLFYGTEGIPEPEMEDCLLDTAQIHCTFTLFLPQSLPLGAKNSPVYEDVQSLRNDQRYSTIPFELWEDLRMIDGVISEDACTVAFREDGSLYTEFCAFPEGTMNFCTQSLASILKRGYPKIK